MIIKNRPQRLDRVFAGYDPPVYFVTFGTRDRRPILAKASVHEALREYGSAVAARHCAVGRYVIMPDHVHLFVAVGGALTLSQFVRVLKQRMGLALSKKGEGGPHWQPGFFDHLLRSGESYGEKWNYVRDNPVRAGLVAQGEDWPFAGEILRIERK